MLMTHTGYCVGRMGWVSEDRNATEGVPYEIRFTHKKSHSAN